MAVNDGIGRGRVTNIAWNMENFRAEILAREAAGIRILEQSINIKCWQVEQRLEDVFKRLDIFMVRPNKNGKSELPRDTDRDIRSNRICERERQSDETVGGNPFARDN